MKDEKDWSTATDEELINKTKTDYTIGTIFKSVRDGLTCYVSDGNINISDTSIFVDGNKVFDCMRNKWAEIISQPKEASPEPKAGDMVEASDIISFADYWKVRYTGGKTKKGFYIVETDSGKLEGFPYIRLPHKSEAESAIKSIKEEYHRDERSFDWALDKAIKWGQQNPDKK